MENPTPRRKRENDTKERRIELINRGGGGLKGSYQKQIHRAGYSVGRAVGGVPGETMPVEEVVRVPGKHVGVVEPGFHSARSVHSNEQSRRQGRYRPTDEPGFPFHFRKMVPCPGVVKRKERLPGRDTLFITPVDFLSGVGL